MSNLEIVEKMYQCFKNSDLETLKNEVFTEDLEWNLPGHNPIAGTKKGINEVLGFLGSLRKLGINVTPLGMGEIGEDSVAEFYQGEGEVNGVQLNALNCNRYKIRDGKIAEVQVFMSDQHGYDAFCWEAFKLKAIPERLAS